MYVSICLFLIFVHLSGESLYIDSNKCAPLPSFLPFLLRPSLAAITSIFFLHCGARWTQTPYR